jgi:quercetin dioxygenase-like cupin family protein
MRPDRKLIKAAGVVLVLFGVSIVASFPAKATPPSNIAFTPVGRATVPEFDVKRKDKAVEKADDFEIRLEAPQAIDIATQLVTFQPHGYSGWHTHPGPVYFTVKTGKLTVYEGDDPTCTGVTFTAGTGAVEAGSSSHLHMVRNETDSVAEALVTYMVPVGTTQAQLRTDKADPTIANPLMHCPF